MSLFHETKFERAFSFGVPAFIGTVFCVILVAAFAMVLNAFGVGNSARQRHANEEAREYFQNSESISQVSCMMESDGTGYIPCRVKFQDGREEMLGCAEWAYVRTNNGCVPYRMIQVSAQGQQFQQVHQDIQNGQNIQQQGVDAVRDQNQIISQ